MYQIFYLFLLLTFFTFNNPYYSFSTVENRVEINEKRNLINKRKGLFIVKDLFQGQIKKVIPEENKVFISSNQLHLLNVKNKILYVHKNPKDPYILRIKNISNTKNELEAELLYGNWNGLELGSQVNNVYNWNAFEYSIKAIYINQKDKMSIESNIVLPKQFVAYSAFGRKKMLLKLEDISAINFNYDFDEDQLNVVSFEIKNSQKTIEIEKTDLNLNKYFPLDKENVYTTTTGNVKFTNEHLKKLILVKKGKGVFRTLTFHYGFSNSISTESVENSKDKNLFKTTFRFLNYEIGQFALEIKLSYTQSKEKIKKIISYLQHYSEDSIEEIFISSSFNNWNEDWNNKKWLLRKKDQAYHEISVNLAPGIYEYYFVIFFKDTKYNKNIFVKVLDPYSGSGLKELGLECANHMDSSKETYLSNNVLPYINSYLNPEDDDALSEEENSSIDKQDDASSSQEKVTSTPLKRGEVLFPVKQKFQILSISANDSLLDKQINNLEEKDSLNSVNSLNQDKENQNPSNKIYIDSLYSHSNSVSLTNIPSDDSFFNKQEDMTDKDKEILKEKKDINYFKSFLKKQKEGFFKVYFGLEELSLIESLKNQMDQKLSIKKIILLVNSLSDNIKCVEILNLNSNSGIWEKEIFLPMGNYEYQYQIYFDDNNVKPLFISDDLNKKFSSFTID